MGDKGVEVVDSHGSEIIPSFQVESVLDTTGAGDMFAAGFLYKLLKGVVPKICFIWLQSVIDNSAIRGKTNRRDFEQFS